MTRLTLPIACLTVLLICGGLHAQRRTPGFVNRPTLSPYLNLFRANNGGLNSYFAYVRPQLEVQQFVQDATRQVNLNSMAIQQEAIELQQALLPSTQSATLQQRPTSTSAVRRPAGRFMSFGTFYPSNASRNTRRR